MEYSEDSQLAIDDEVGDAVWAPYYFTHIAAFVIRNDSSRQWKGHESLDR
jgi:hypothetical protein